MLTVVPDTPKVQHSHEMNRGSYVCVGEGRGRLSKKHQILNTAMQISTMGARMQTARANTLACQIQDALHSRQVFFFWSKMFSATQRNTTYLVMNPVLLRIA